MIAAVGVVVLAAGAAVVSRLGGGDEDTAGRHAVVSTTRNMPTVNVFFGTSCTGLHGSWFLNVVQGGSQAQLHASYYLRWTFTSTEVVAKPGGRITVSGGTGPPPSLTVTEGVVTLTGARTDGTSVTGTGQIDVTLTGTDDEPSLTITQKGLEDAARTLGLVLPFPFDGRPLTVPIELQEEASGC